MATSLSARLAFAADPATAFALLTDATYVEEVALATGGRDPQVTVTLAEDAGATIVSVRTLPAQVPSYAKALVGGDLVLTETRVLGPADADGTRAGTFTVDFAGAPMQVTGSMRLVATATGSEVDIEMSVKASVPFIGGKIEKFSAGQIEQFLAREEKVAAARLA